MPLFAPGYQARLEHFKNAQREHNKLFIEYLAEHPFLYKNLFPVMDVSYFLNCHSISVVGCFKQTIVFRVEENAASASIEIPCLGNDNQNSDDTKNSQKISPVNTFSTQIVHGQTAEEYLKNKALTQALRREGAKDFNTYLDDVIRSGIFDKAFIYFLDRGGIKEVIIKDFCGTKLPPERVDNIIECIKIEYTKNNYELSFAKTSEGLVTITFNLEHDGLPKIKISLPLDVMAIEAARLFKLNNSTLIEQVNILAFKREHADDADENPSPQRQPRLSPRLQS